MLAETASNAHKAMNHHEWYMLLMANPVPYIFSMKVAETSTDINSTMLPNAMVLSLSGFINRL